MEVPSLTPRAATWMGVGAVVATVAIGVVLRLVDPLSSAVIAAEDPFTHMVLVREHLMDGSLDPLNNPGGLYPPGMHAFVAAVFSFTGIQLYDLFRWGPVVLGGIGVVGMATLLWRQAGPAAGFVGALGFAVAPEVIFRTTMMSPTALDMALLPFFLLASLEILEGDLRWLALGIPLASFFLFAHPWLFGLLSIAGLALVVLSLMLPWPVERAPRASPAGAASVLALVGAGLGLGATGCGGMCGPGFSGLLPDLLAGGWFGPAVVAGSLLPAGLVALRRDQADAVFEALLPEGGRRMPVWGKALVSIALAGLVAGVTAPALAQGMPELVDLPRMFGWPILAAAAFAFVLLPFLSSPAAHLGAGLAMATYPLVIFNPFGSPFWSHRTAVFLGVGLVVLLGVASRALVVWGRRVVETVELPSTPPGWTATRLLVGSGLLVAASMGGAVYAGTPDGYESGWYRLYQSCEFHALEDVADRTDAADDAIVVTGSWQSRLVLSSLNENPSSVWAKPSIFYSERDRGELVGGLQSEDRPLFVVVERHLNSEHPEADPGFLEDDDWTQEDTWCLDSGIQTAPVTLYRHTGGTG